MRRAEPLLVVEGLGKRFGGLRAVEDLSFTIRRDEVLGIIGPNGAGKTTAINLISGVIRSDTGTVTFEGQPVTRLPTHVLARHGIVRTFQATTVYPDETVRENCLRGAYLHLYSGFWSALLSTSAARRRAAEVERRISATLSWLGLSNLGASLAGSLPYGHQKMLGLAIALMAEPSVILLDEPVAGLSAQEADRIKETIKIIHQRGIAVAVVDHNMVFMSGLCDRIIVMQQGRKIAEGAPTDVMRDPLVIEAYLGRKHARPAS